MNVCNQRVRERRAIARDGSSADRLVRSNGDCVDEWHGLVDCGHAIFGDTEADYCRGIQIGAGGEAFAVCQRSVSAHREFPA